MIKGWQQWRLLSNMLTCTSLGRSFCQSFEDPIVTEGQMSTLHPTTNFATQKCTNLVSHFRMLLNVLYYTVWKTREKMSKKVAQENIAWIFALDVGEFGITGPMSPYKGVVVPGGGGGSVIRGEFIPRDVPPGTLVPPPALLKYCKNMVIQNVAEKCKNVGF